MVRSRWAWTRSPLIADAAKPRDLSFSASTSVACLVRTNTIIPSPDSTSRTRVRASSLACCITWIQRCRTVAVDVLASGVAMSTGSWR